MQRPIGVFFSLMDFIFFFSLDKKKGDQKKNESEEIKNCDTCSSFLTEFSDICFSQSNGERPVTPVPRIILSKIVSALSFALCAKLTL